VGSGKLDSVKAADRAQVYGLAREVSLIGGTAAGVVEVEPDMDELARLRAKRAGA